MRRTREVILRGMIVIMVGLIAAGCESGVGDPNPQDPAPQMPDPQSPNPPPPSQKPPAKDDEQPADPSGIWKHETGPFASWTYDGAEWKGEYLVLRPDGTFRMVIAETRTGALECYDGIYVTVDDILLVSFDYGGEGEFVFDEGSSFVVYSLPDESTLAFKSAGGDLTKFSRQTELPFEFDCHALTTVATFAGLEVFPDYESGLAFDGDQLWFTDYENGDVYPVDPITGALGTPIELSSARYVHATQGDEFWTSDGNDEAQRRSKADVLGDSIKTDTDLDLDFEITAMAFNPDNQTLWLHGYDYTDNVNRFHAVNAGAEPDVLLVSALFGPELVGATWDGTYLWGLTDNSPQALLQIHPRTFKVLVTYQLESSANYYNGIASVGSSTFLIGVDYNSESGVLTEVKPAE